ncbi:MAG: hypothetical protein J6U13_07370 [Salinivirgaceae bacterium]|nr:hypothetical protein [Salinivirgaceae bacterium]
MGEKENLTRTDLCASVKFARGVRGRFSAVGWKLAPIVGWQVLTCEWNAEGFGWEEARIAIWGWALVAPIETEGRDWACQCEGLGTAIQGCGLEAFGMERTRQRLNYEKLLAVRGSPCIEERGAERKRARQDR